MGIARELLGHGPEVYNIIFIICFLFYHFCKKVVLRLSEHGDVIKTQK